MYAFRSLYRTVTCLKLNHKGMKQDPLQMMNE